MGMRVVLANGMDRGIGFSEADALSVPKTFWGQNLLGKALVEVRERIRREAEDAAGAKSASSFPVG